MPSVDDTTAYFDKHAARLKADRLIDKSGALHDLLFRRLKSASRVLEIGAGTGLYTLPLLRAGHRVHAVDLSQASLGQIRERVEGDLRERLSTQVGKFPDVTEGHHAGSFDAIVFIK